jgi:hypothetical protein
MTRAVTPSRWGLPVALLLVLALPGCGGSAVLIARTKNGGVLGLDGHREQAMADARRQMSEYCGGAYTIVGERNAVAGTFRGRVISEYQIRYLCGSHPEHAITPTPEQEPTESP